jgi:hypothetical protein
VAAGAAVVLGAVLASLLAGCTTSVDYVGSASHGVFFKVPNTWEVIDVATLKRLGLAVDAAANTQAAASGTTYPVYVSLATASRRLIAKGGPNFFAPQPWALANVVSFGASDQASMSLTGLNDLLFPVDQWQQQGLSVQQIGNTALIVRGALRGSRVVFEAQTPSGSLGFEQVAFINSPTDKAWDLAVGCSVACFQAHRRVIDDIVKSFTVTARGT